MKGKTKKLEQKEEKVQKDKKEILNNLLKQLIDQKLNKLEKNNISEIKSFQLLSNDAQNLIVTLENLSNNVRKQITFQRQKYINNFNKALKSNKKSSNMRQTSPKTLPKSKSKKQLDLKRTDSKSYEKYSIQTDKNARTTKSKPKKKLPSNIKNDDNGRKTVGNSNNNYNKTTLIPHSKQRRPITPFKSSKLDDKFNKTMINKPSNITQRRISAQRNTVGSNKEKLNKTEIASKKNNAKFPNKVNKKVEKPKLNIKTNENAQNIITNINTLDKYDNNLDDSRLKELDMFRKADKNSDEIENLNINKEINNYDKNNTGKNESKCNFLASLSKELDLAKVNTIKMDEKLVNDSLLVKNDINKDNLLKDLNLDLAKVDTIKMDEKLVNDSLLVKNDMNKGNSLKELDLDLEKVSTIKMDENLVNDSLLVTNNINGGKKVNLVDSLFRGPTFQEIELNVEKIKSDNTNINKHDNLIKKNTKKKELNSSVAIYNKLKRSKVTFLENEKDFDLIFKESKIEDLNMGNNNLNDLNITFIDDEMSLQEKFESNLDMISRYLDTRDIFNLMLVNKECFKNIINFLISKTEISIELLQDEINKLKDLNPTINFENLKKNPFKLSSNSKRAISLLNSSSGNNILKLNIDQLNKKEIILIYSLYFVAIGLKKDILILNEKEKIEYMQSYFKRNCIGQNIFGKFVENELNGKILDDKTISTIYNLSKKQLDIISPNYFQRINKDIAIFVFIIKDLLEQLGLLGSQFIKPEKEYILLNSRLLANKAILDELNKIEENIY